MADKRIADASWLSAIVASSNEAIVSTDPEGIITSWNPAAERIYGYSAAEIIAKPNALIIPFDRRDEEAAIRRRIFAGEPVGRYNTVRIHKDGRRLDISLVASPLRDAAGSIVGVSKISYDISEQRRAERIKDESLAIAQRLAAIVESTDDAIIGLDLDGTIRAAEQMYGYLADEAIGRPITITLPPERRQEEAAFLDRIKRGERIAAFETV